MVKLRPSGWEFNQYIEQNHDIIMKFSQPGSKSRTVGFLFNAKLKTVHNFAVLWLHNFSRHRDDRRDERRDERREERRRDDRRRDDRRRDDRRRDDRHRPPRTPTTDEPIMSPPQVRHIRLSLQSNSSCFSDNSVMFQL